MNTGFEGKPEVVAAGDELALIFPQQLVDHLQAREGDTLYREPTVTGFGTTEREMVGILL